MPQPPRSYGAPLGPQAAIPGAQRPKPGPASAAQIHQALQARDAQLQAELQRNARIRAHLDGQRPTRRDLSAPRGQKGGVNLRVEKALKDAGG